MSDIEPRIKGAVRIEKATGKPALFFYDEVGILMCFTFNEGHNAVAYDYYLDQTTRADYYDEKIKNFMQSLQFYFDGSIRFAERLSLSHK